MDIKQLMQLLSEQKILVHPSGSEEKKLKVKLENQEYDKQRYAEISKEFNAIGIDAEGKSVYDVLVELSSFMMKDKYLSLCNWHLSMYGDSVAYFEGSDYGKSPGGYTSDIRHAYLFDEDANRHGEVMINIKDLGLSEKDFQSVREGKLPHYLVKDYIIRNTEFSHSQVCKFENERDAEEEKAKRFGYCTLSGGICDGSECSQYEIDEYSEENECPDNIKWVLCQDE